MGRRSRSGPLRVLGGWKDCGLILLLEFCLRGGLLVISPNEQLSVFDASVFALNPKTQQDDDILSQCTYQSSLYFCSFTSPC